MNRFCRVCPFPVAMVSLCGQALWLCAGFIGLLVLSAAGADIQTNLLVSAGSLWKYLDHGSDQGTQWRSQELELTGISVPPVLPEIVRGPYLQQGTSSSMLVRWRTNVPTDSEVRVHDWVGFERVFSDATPTSNHAVRVTGLLPDTGYWYTAGTSERIMAGADLSHYFVTAPTNSRLTKVWVIGDAGTQGGQQRAVYEAARAFGSPDVWLMLGDNAYPSGTDTDYQAAVFDMYPDTLRMTPVWPAIGNHEQEGRSGTSAHFPYLDIFSPPENGEAGGVASGTKRYYSFDYANIHFVCLDSWTSDRSSNGPMCTWLRQDLAETSKDWIIAFWHHPPYSQGHHHSDYELELIEMRENAVPILEAAGADLVLCGHSHSYERSFLINGHYGYSLSFQQSMKMDSGSGRRDGSGPYFKPPTGPKANQGTVYVVAGCSGLVSPSQLGHPAMFFGELELGSLVLFVNGSTLEAQFVHANLIDDEPIAVSDSFMIYKGSPVHVVVRRIDAMRVHFSWNTQPGLYYSLQRATNLTRPDWTELTVGGQAEASLMTVTLPISAELPTAFYRVLEYID